MMKYFILGLISFSVVFSQSCTTKLSEVVLYPSTDENKIWKLQDTFFTGSDLTYSISDDSIFYLQQQIFATDVFKSFGLDFKIDNPTIVQVVPERTQLRTWTNQFALLSQDPKNTSVYWASGKPQESRQSPDFNKITYLQPRTTTNCLGLAYLDKDTVIVDCFDSTSYKNYYYVTNLVLGVQEYETQNIIGHSIISRRITQVYKYTKDSGDDSMQILEIIKSYLFRGVPFLAGDIKFRNQSVIEVYSIDNTQNKPTFTGNFLDAQTLARISNNTQTTSFGFNLVDFKITSDGIIYVLDSQTDMKIYRVQYQDDGSWLYNGMIENPDAQAIAFDVNTQVDTGITRVAVLFQGYFLIYYWPQDSKTFTSFTLFQLDYDIQGAAPQFSLSDSLLFIQDSSTNFLYAYDIKKNELLTTIQLYITTTLLVNPLYDIAISVSSKKSQAWSITQGLLILEAPKTKLDSQTIRLTATYDGETICSSNITFKVYDKEDWNIYPIPEQAKQLDYLLTYPTQSQFIIQPQATGPNLNYEFSDVKKDSFLAVRDSSVFQVYQFMGLEVKNQTYPIASNVIFSDTISVDNDQVYIQAIQTKDFKVTFWQCTVTQTIPAQSDCIALGIIQTSKLLSNKGFYQFTHLNQVIAIIQDLDFQINLYSCEEQVCQQYSTIQYSPQAGNQITSFILQRQHIWVLRQSSNTIDIYSAFGDSELIDSITSKSLMLGKDVFAPTQLFTNRIFSDLVFVNNQNGLLVMNYKKVLTLYTIIPYTLINPQVHVAAGKDTFFLSQYDTKTSLLYQYNLVDLSNIVFQNNMTLYWYTFQQPLQGKVSEANGYLFVRVLCTKTQKTFILSFAPNTIQRDSLNYAINTGVLVEDNQNLIFSVGGTSDMFVYINFGPSHSNNKLLKKPFFTVDTPQPTTNDLFQSFSYNLNVQNYDFEGKNVQTFTQNFTLMNTQTNITLRKSAFDDKTNGLFSTNNNTEQTLDLDNTWYDGQVLRFEIECPDCNKNIKIRNHVELEKLKIDYTKASDFATWKNQTIVQTPDTVELFVNNSFSQTLVTLTRPTPDFSCSLVTATEDAEFIVSICQDSTQVYAYITQCDSANECRAIFYIPLTGVTKVAKVRLAGSKLFVLNSNWQNPLQYNGNLLIYNLILDGKKIVARKDFDFNQYKSNKAEYITDFDIVELKYNEQEFDGYQIYLTAAYSGVYSMKITSDGKDLISVKREWFVDFKDFFLPSQPQKQFTSNDTIFLSVNILQSSQKNVSSDQVDQIFITTSNVAHYAMVQNNYKYLKELTYSGIQQVAYQILFVVNRYGSLPTLNKVRVSNNTIAIPYGDQKNNTIVLAIYEMGDLNGQNFTAIQMKGGYSMQLTKEQYNNFALEYQAGNQTQLLTNGENLIIYNQNLQLSITNGPEIKEQTLEVIAKNDFSQTSIKTQIHDGGRIEDGSKWKLTYTLLIVLGLVIIFGVIGFFVLQYRKKQQVREFRANSLLSDEIDPVTGQVQRGENQSESSTA